MDAGVHFIEISHTKVSIYAPHKPQTCHLVIWQGAASKVFLKLQNLESHSSKNSKPPMLWNDNMLPKHSGLRPLGALGPNEFI